MIENYKDDLSASVVVFLVALPLCLGIALASGAPLFAGIISGIVGGIIVGLVSGSPLGVSGPAAGLVVIVFSAIESLGSWETFLLAVMIAGIIQLVMGFIKAGFIAYFFPSSVIKGMLSGIGLLIIIKQIPHAVGYDKYFIGDLSFNQMGDESSFASLISSFYSITPTAVLISIVSLALLILWEVVLTKKHKIFSLIQGPLVVVVLGIAVSYILENWFYSYGLHSGHLVRLPVADSFTSFIEQFNLPNFSAITNYNVWQVGVVLALVASLETLLCVEATDKLDPHKRVTPTNRELKAQGLGNIVCGLIGGLPVTQVIIRSSANIAFGAKTKLSTILHGLLLLVSVVFLAELLNYLPLATLATILIVVGYKLAKPSLFIHMYKLGSEQFIPFVATIVGILATDLLKGIAIGMFFGIFYTLRHSYRNAYYMNEVVTDESGQITKHIVLAEEVSFFNKASIIKLLDGMPESSTVVVDCTNSKSIDYDVVEYIKGFRKAAKTKNITFSTIGFIEPDNGLY